MKFYEINTKPRLKLRIFATLIDYGIYWALFFVYASFFGVETSEGHWELTGLPALPPFLFWLIYFPGLEAFNQSTPGHDIFKLKIFKVNGESIGFIDAFKRRLCDPLDIFLYGIPALICIKNTDKNQRIGDLLAGTVVAKKEDVTETEFSLK